MKHLTVTLTGAAIPLSTKGDVFVQDILIQPGVANSHVAYIGGSGLTSSDYGARIEVPVSTVLLSPLSLMNGKAGTLIMA